MYPVDQEAPRMGYGPGGSLAEPHPIPGFQGLGCTPSEIVSLFAVGPAILPLYELHCCSSTTVVSTLWGTQQSRFKGFTAAQSGFATLTAGPVSAPGRPPIRGSLDAGIHSRTYPTQPSLIAAPPKWGAATGGLVTKNACFCQVMKHRSGIAGRNSDATHRICPRSAAHAAPPRSAFRTRWPERTKTAWA